MGLCDFIGQEKTAPAIVSSLPPPLQNEPKLAPIEEKPTSEEERRRSEEEQSATAFGCLCCYLCVIGLFSS